jgi:hypothetical protein
LLAAAFPVAQLGLRHVGQLVCDQA